MQRTRVQLRILSFIRKKADSHQDMEKPVRNTWEVRKSKEIDFQEEMCVCECECVCVCVCVRSTEIEIRVHKD